MKHTVKVEKVAVHRVELRKADIINLLRTVDQIDAPSEDEEVGARVLIPGATVLDFDEDTVVVVAWNEVTSEERTL